MTLVAYSDADYANSKSRHSRTGCVFVVNNGPISWMSRKQTLIATSTCEAEYGAAFEAAKQVIWLRRLMSELGCTADCPTPLAIDNNGAIAVIMNPGGNHKRAKPWDVQAKFTGEQVEQGTITVKHVPSNVQFADFLTKPLPPALFTRNISQFMCD